MLPGPGHFRSKDGCSPAPRWHWRHGRPSMERLGGGLGPNPAAAACARARVAKVCILHGRPSTQLRCQCERSTFQRSKAAASKPGGSASLFILRRQTLPAPRGPGQSRARGSAEASGPGREAASGPGWTEAGASRPKAVTALASRLKSSQHR